MVPSDLMPPASLRESLSLTVTPASLRESPSLSVTSTSSTSLPTHRETNICGLSPLTPAPGLAQSLVHTHSQRTPGCYLPNANSHARNSSHAKGQPCTNVHWENEHEEPGQGQTNNSASQNRGNSSDASASVFAAAAKMKRTPLKHERIVVAAESPPDAQLYVANSPASNGPDGTNAGGYAVQGCSHRLKLKLTAVHPVLTLLMQRCGFNAQLQLTFKPRGKSMGRFLKAHSVFLSSLSSRLLRIALEVVVDDCGVSSVGVLTLVFVCYIRAASQPIWLVNGERQCTMSWSTSCPTDLVRVPARYSCCTAIAMVLAVSLGGQMIATCKRAMCTQSSGRYEDFLHSGQCKRTRAH
jgi:hypothetical protein